MKLTVILCIIGVIHGFNTIPRLGFVHKLHQKSDHSARSSVSKLLGASTKADKSLLPCKIKVVGVGGAGGNAVSRMMQVGVPGVEFSAINTDAQVLKKIDSLYSECETLTIGKKITRGMGAGGIPENGRLAAIESRDDIMKAVEGCDLVFVTAGMGGGTGSGAAPIVAECAREAGALAVGVVSKPFGFEGRRRMQQALQAIEALRGAVDTLIVVSNDRLLQITPENTPLEKAFLMADDVLRQGVIGISEIIIKPGLINVDFADVRTVMHNAGTALMGIGSGSGKTRAIDAARAAVSSPLLDFPIERARGVIFNIVGGEDLTLQEINAAADMINGAVDPNANVIFGSLIDPAKNGQVEITVIATGFPASVTDVSASTAMKGVSSSAAAVVNQAAQQVQDQAQILRTQILGPQQSLREASRFGVDRDGRIVTSGTQGKKPSISAAAKKTKPQSRRFGFGFPR